MNKDIIIIADYSKESAPLSLDELCEICNVSPQFIDDLISYEIIVMESTQPEEWIFDLQHLRRVRTAVRLQRDLEVNMAGIAVVLDLLEEIETLRERTQFLERYFDH